MRILGIDPGTHRLGWGVIEKNGAMLTPVAHGCIQPEPGLFLGDQLVALEKQLIELILVYHPDQMAIEELYFVQNVTTGLKVAEARGVVLLVARRASLPIAEYKPNLIKSTVAGFGHAKKDQIQRMVQLTLKLPTLPKPDDAADGLAVAICHASHLKFAANTIR